MHKARRWLYLATVARDATVKESMSAPESRFVKACRALPVDRTPVWFMRQAGRYMPEYRAVRKQYSLIEICKRPEVAAEVTITAAEALDVDAAIIFADLLLPLEVMGLPFHFSPGEGPVIEKPVRDQADISRLRTDRAADLGYVSEAVRLVCKHFGPRLPVIGFCGAPFTLASYMIEGGSSRNYVNTKKMMYSSPAAWDELLGKLVAVVSEYAAEQVRAGADVIQVFDSWVGCLSVDDYRRYVLPRTTELVKALQKAGVADHLFWHGQRYAFVFDERDRRRSDRPGLANSSGCGVEGGRFGSGAGKPGSRPAFCQLEGNRGERWRDSAPCQRTGWSYF